MLAFEKRTPTKAAQINRGREDPVVDFSTLVEALGWRALSAAGAADLYLSARWGNRRGASDFCGPGPAGPRYWCAAAKLRSKWRARTLALSNGPRVHRRFFWLFICWGDRSSCAPAQSGAAAADPPKALRHHQRRSTVGGADHLVDPLQDGGFVHSNSRAADDALGGHATSLPVVRREQWHDPAASGNSLALLQYTSGSTTTPRGVMVSHGNLIHNSAHIGRCLRGHAGLCIRDMAAGLP